MGGIIFAPAERQKAKLRLAVTGPSGSGKTYTSILVGRGLVGPEGRIAVADTEYRSAALYSDLTNYDQTIITAPYEVEKYIQVIKAAEEAGYDLLILDSVTPVWKFSGGLLEQQEKEAEANRNKFSSWRNVSKEYQRLIEAIITSKIHIIVTLRSQTAYDMDASNDSGRVAPTKIGLKPEMREGFDYEFTTVLNMTNTKAGHLATVSKDRTRLFDSVGPFIPSEETGVVLRHWLESGVAAKLQEPVPSFTPVSAPPAAPEIKATLEKKKPARIYDSRDVAKILKTYHENGWDTAGIIAAKIDNNLYDRDAIETDYKLWSQWSTSPMRPEPTAAPTPSSTPAPVEKPAQKPESKPAEPVEKKPEPKPVQTPAAPSKPVETADKPAEKAEESAPEVPETTGEYHCEKCGIVISKTQHDVSRLFQGKALCKEHMV